MEQILFGKKKLFTPFLEDQPLSYAEARPQFYRNDAREDEWGEPVYFAPPTWELGKTGTGGPYYLYGYNARSKKGKFGNCTWFCICRHLEVAGEILTCIIGPAVKSFDKYTGRKDGGGLDGEYIGDTIRAGDMLVFADNLSCSGNGHIAHVEKVLGDTLYIAESGYSTKECYRNKTCITYTLDRRKIVSGNKISLRPVQPYSEYVYGVIHTGDCFEEGSSIDPVQKDETRDQVYVSSAYVRMREEPSTSSTSYGYWQIGYYNVTDTQEKSDYTWYKLNDTLWIADTTGVEFIEASK